MFDLDVTTTIDVETSDVVDNIFVYPDVDAVLSTDDPFSDPVTFTGNANYSHLELAFRLTCGEDQYGPDCTFCVDNITGHYTCDNVTGVRVCLEGYQGSECDQCVPAQNCSECDCVVSVTSKEQNVLFAGAEGGYCTQPGECFCHNGYSGDNCGEHILHKFHWFIIINYGMVFLLFSHLQMTIYVKFSPAVAMELASLMIQVV